MENFDALIVGGGAAGMIAALLIARGGGRALLLEKNDRLGKKFAATGNGQGNLTNRDISPARYHGARALAAALSERYGYAACAAFYESVGCLLAEGKEGRVYPASFQAASVVDNLRFALAAAGVRVVSPCTVTGLSPRGGGYDAETTAGTFSARFALAAFGGAAGPVYGTDGSSFHLMRALGHSVTALSPALVQLTTDRAFLKGLKGVKADAVVRVIADGRERARARGDVLFTDYGVSGSAVFPVSGEALRPGAELSVGFLPDVPEEKLAAALGRKAREMGYLRAEEFFCGILPKQVGRSVLRAENIAFDTPAGALAGRAGEIAAFVKDVRLAVEGSTGFAGAQVTKGGVPGSEITECMESRKSPGLFLAGELVDVDGDCGGYNLHWAFASASRAAETILGRLKA